MTTKLTETEGFDLAEIDQYAAEQREAVLEQEAAAAQAQAEAEAAERIRANVNAELSAEMAGKVHDLLDQRRVLVHAAFQASPDRRQREGDERLWQPYTYAYVMGDSEPYVVKANNDGVWCSCPAGRMHPKGDYRCAHTLAAMAVWAEMAE